MAPGTAGVASPRSPQLHTLTQTYAHYSGMLFFLCTVTHFKRERKGEREEEVGSERASEREEEELVSIPLIAFVRFRSCDQLAFVRNHMHLERG